MNVAPDKILHFLGGAAIAALTALGATWAGLSPAPSVLLACGAAALAGAAKEALDALGFGRVEFADFVFTWAGAIPVGVLWLVLG